jgi:hypothetical protein
MLRLQGAGVEEEGEEEGGAGMMALVALMSADHWCVCALSR